MSIRKSIATLSMIALAWCATAAAQSAVIPRISRAPRDAQRTFEILKNYFSSNGAYKILRADPAEHTLVAKRNGIDTESWSDWAYCEMGPEHLLDTLDDGAVTLTVKIKPISKDSSEVSVTADFEATYGLGDAETTTQCVSHGVLENQVLQLAGAASQDG
ncbi:MAG TPA: hypothetical protein VJN94_16535 [Candidatus Binataceae bacterium]|nr:hypothetical protein [Candidatus Binataceae bacterium]